MGSLVIPERDANGRFISYENAVASNATSNGKILYAAIHGMKQNVAQNGTHKFRFSIPYTEILFFGAEISHSGTGLFRANFFIKNPVTDEVIEQYGHDVNIPNNYVRTTNYAATLPQGLILECEVFNETSGAADIGINFLMHELRDPV